MVFMDLASWLPRVRCMWSGYRHLKASSVRMISTLQLPRSTKSPAGGWVGRGCWGAERATGGSTLEKPRRGWGEGAVSAGGQHGGGEPAAGRYAAPHALIAQRACGQRPSPG